MSTIALIKLLINRTPEINDVALLNAVKKILDHKTQTQSLVLTPEQKMEIIESQKEIELGLFVEQAELDKEFNKWHYNAEYIMREIREKLSEQYWNHPELLKQEMEAIRQKCYLKITPLNPN